MLPLGINRLEHEQCPPKVPSAFLCYSLIEIVCLGPTFLLARESENRAYLFFRRRSYPDQQSPGTDGSNDIRGTIGQEDQPHVRTVLLHCPSQSRLSITSQMIRLIDHNNLEPLLCRKINLLRLRNLLQ